MITLKNYINGALCAPVSGNYLDNYNPAKGEVYARVPDSGAEDVELAWEAACAAFPAWKNTAAEDKFKVLNRIAELIDIHQQKLAEAESLDQGKPVWLAKNEMTRAGQNFRFFATAAMQFGSESHAMEDKAINYTLRQPIGVVGCISP
jgi:aminomuconate-semialdehyde/2-hydroxymuconate-6-semialdehyde dehydrogenase